MFEQNKATFLEEAGELLSELEDALLEMEEAPQDLARVDKVFRSMHTIKGSGAMFGFDAIADFTHEVETVFDLVRNGQNGNAQPDARSQYANQSQPVARRAQ